jgi:beta-lactamase regulating signal transducer with metallopeptidase domain/biopolymer transport protein ExbD
MIELATRCGETWVGYFGTAVIQNTVFLSFIFLVLHLIRWAPANLKYGICLVGLVKLLCPPFLPVHFFGTSAGSLPVTLPATLRVMLPVADTALSSLSASAGTQRTSLTVPGLLFLLWVGSSVFYIALTLVRTFHVRRLLKGATRLRYEVPGPGGALRSTEVLRSDLIPTAITFGLFPGRIYVPAAWDSWTEKQRRMVVGHEIAHILRFDSLARIGQVIALGSYLFHPLVWLLSHRMDQYREMACDDAVVVGHPDRADAYSRCLVEIAESSMHDPRLWGSASALLRHRNGLLKRIQYLMKEGKMQIISKRVRGLIFAGLALLILPLSLYCSNAETDGDVRAATNRGSYQRPKGMEEIEITIQRDGLVALEGRSLTVKELAAVLGERTKDHKDNVVIRMLCEEGTEMVSVSAVQKALVEMNLRKVVYGSDLPLVLPPEDNAERLARIPKEHITVLRIEGPGLVVLDGKPIGLGDITDAIRTRLAEDDKLIVSIDWVGQSSFEDFVRVLAMVKAAGAQRISLVLQGSDEE